MDSVFNTIVEKLQQGEKVTIAGFGRFEMRERKTKSFTNPKTGGQPAGPHHHSGL